MADKFVCNFAWKHLSIHPHGMSSICCVANHGSKQSRARNGNRLVRAGTNRVIDIINSASYREIRQQMLEGEIPEACRTCALVEQAGGESKRTTDAARLRVPNPALYTDSDGTIVPDILDLELRLGNYCNLRCRGCNAESSTSWIQDYHELKNVIRLPSDYDSVVEDPGTNYDWCESTEFYRDVLSNAPNLKNLHISGGEPFLVPKHFELLEMLLSSGRNSVHVFYITNLNYNFDKLKPALDLLRQFHYVNISFSIDDVGAGGEYIRKNSDWSLMLENLRRFQTEYPQFHYSITQTVMAYNFKTVDRLYHTLKAQNLLPEQGIRLNHIHSPEYLSALVYSRELRQQVISGLDLPEEMLENLRGRYWQADANGLYDEFIRVTQAVDTVRRERVEDYYAITDIR